jgi:hypothetical protein
MISTTEIGRIGRVQIDDGTLSQGMDHSMVTAAIPIKENRTIQNIRHTRVACKKESAEEFYLLIREKIGTQEPLSQKVDGLARIGHPTQSNHGRSDAH